MSYEPPKIERIVKSEDFQRESMLALVASTT